ncbi:hypothetical protein D3C72_1719980 [compost metagenome]
MAVNSDFRAGPPKIRARPAIASPSPATLFLESGSLNHKAARNTVSTGLRLGEIMAPSLAGAMVSPRKVKAL